MLCHNALSSSCITKEYQKTVMNHTLKTSLRKMFSLSINGLQGQISGSSWFYRTTQKALTQVLINLTPRLERTLCQRQQENSLLIQPEVIRDLSNEVGKGPGKTFRTAPRKTKLGLPVFSWKLSLALNVYGSRDASLSLFAVLYTGKFGILRAELLISSKWPPYFSATLLCLLRPKLIQVHMEKQNQGLPHVLFWY